MTAIVNDFKDKGYVSEWNTNNGYLDYNNEVTFANDIALRYQAGIFAGLQMCYFTWRGGVGGVGTQWAASPSNGVYRNAFFVLNI